jgi:citrate lyase subunit beta/citryl-CoA lyase
MSVPPLTWLYVPADRGDRIAKALASRAHAVIVDLEDGVAPHAKEAARANLSALAAQVPHAEKRVFVRVNAGNSADLGAVALVALDGILVPKVEEPDDLPELELPIVALIESAAGLEAAYEIARHPRVAGLGLGEADLRSQTGATDLDWARARLVNAAVAARLPRPAQSAYTHVHDEQGLAASCRRGRELGHLGRAAIHPAQLPVIEAAYLPTTDELERARETIARLESDAVGTLEGGEFVDAAMLGAARQVVALAERYGHASF